MNWKEITTIEEWNRILENSDSQPAVVLKHSTRCPVSSSALEEYEQYLGKEPKDGIGYYLVKVIESRPVSNQMEEDLGVKHASPQIFYVKEKKPYWNTSHWSVTAKHIDAVLS